MICTVFSVPLLTVTDHLRADLHGDAAVDEMRRGIAFLKGLQARDEAGRPGRGAGGTKSAHGKLPAEEKSWLPRLRCITQSRASADYTAAGRET
jgi:hypothetical protein